MNSPSVLDKTYGIIIKRMVKTGQAPHYTEIAAKLGVPVEDGRKALHDLVSVEIPGIWLFPDTDYIGSFCTIQQPSDPVSNYNRWRAKMVRSVRF